MSGAIAIMGIHTGIGKTVVAAVIAEALKADYWKPIQAGSLEDSDSNCVRNLVANKESIIHQEAFRLSSSLSPHAAARIDCLAIDHENIAFPHTDNFLIVETAGGIHSPLNDDVTMVDFVRHFHLPCVLVVRHYLGSINHTLMSIEVMQQRGVQLIGMVIIGEPSIESETFISRYTKLPILAYVPHMHAITAQGVSVIASKNEPALQLLKQ
jgi:dethiobiotin synthetase